MKKLLLPLALGAALLSACNNEVIENNAIIQKVVGSSEAPAITVTPVTIFEKKEEFSREAPADDEYALTQSEIKHLVTGVETGIGWLDDLLYQSMVGDIELEDKQAEQKIKAISNPKDQLKALSEYFYEQEREQAASFESIAVKNQQSLSYLGQRENVASFVQYNYGYLGGAHGVYSNNYFNIDTNRKALITLNDVFAERTHDALTDKLWEAYLDYQRTLNPDFDESEFYANKADFVISPDFYFSKDGITFVYPPYLIGSFAEGEIELTLGWYDAQALINPEYLWDFPEWLE